MTLASSYSFRFVAVTRRDYPGSTPYSTAELAVLTNGTAVEKAKFMTARGVEIATFIDNFIRLYNLPGVSDDGRNGGIAVLGWSLGNAFSIATIASVPTLPADIKQRLAMYTRALIMQGNIFSWAVCQEYSCKCIRGSQSLRPFPSVHIFRHNLGHLR